eukprot:Hpha_TRINITY_DN27234_c0_g1::TRINITY_DN27234_c0_g1_i1::g.140730::m.140730
MGEYGVFVRLDGGELQGVDVPVEGTVGDLRKAAGAGEHSVLSYQGHDLMQNTETLADLGIGPEAVVEVATWSLADDQILVSGAGSPEVNGVYKQVRHEVNGGTQWNKIDPATGQRLSQPRLCLHFYWGPRVAGRVINGWLLGSNDYPINGIYYGRACGDRSQLEANRDKEETEYPALARFLPPEDGWEADTEGLGVAPAPILHGKKVVKGWPMFPSEE